MPRSRFIAMALCLLALTACAYMPWSKKPPAPPEPVHELTITGADGAPATAFPQYWKRNTLVIDLSGASGSGSVTAKLPAETTWPVRVAVRVRPGSVQQVEVQGEERSVLPVAAEGTLPIDIELMPSVFRPTTQALYINWGFMPQFAEVVVEPQPQPGFVSPTQEPRKIEPPPEEAPGANQIISPSDATPPAPKN